MLGHLVGRMIRRSVEKHLRAVYWAPPIAELKPPVVFCSTHFGWFDGYVVFCAVKALNLYTLDWIAEYDKFPMFGHVGGLPMPSSDALRRAETIRRTIRLMNAEDASLVLFADGVLRYPHEDWQVGRASELIARKVPQAQFVPLAIRYEVAKHERPECFMAFGQPEPLVSAADMKVKIEAQWRRIEENMDQRSIFSTLVEGTISSHERTLPFAKS